MVQPIGPPPNVFAAELSETGLARRARDLAEELRPQFQANQRKWIRRRLADVMAGSA